MRGLCPNAHPDFAHKRLWGKCILDDGHAGDCAFKLIDWPKPDRLVIGLDTAASPVCPICRDEITPDTLALQDDGRGVRLDSTGRPWCRACTVHFDGLDPEDLSRSYL